MYILMRGLSVSFLGSFISAIIYVFNGYFLGHVYAGHLTFVQSYIWMPLIFYFQYRFIQTREYKNSVFAGIILGIQILGGFPQIVFYSILGILFLSLFYGIPDMVVSSGRTGIKIGLSLIIILCIGFAFAAIQILPTMEFLRFSTRAGGVDYSFATYESLHPKELLAFLFPNIFGNAIDQTYWRSQESWHFWESCGYVGILPLFLIFIRLEDDSIRRLRGFLLMMIGISLILSLGKYNPLYPIIYKLPGFHSFRIPAQIIFLYIFGMAVISGMGIDRIYKGNWRTNKSFIPFISSMGVVLLLFVTGLNLFPYKMFFYLFRNFSQGPMSQTNMDGLYGRISTSIYQSAMLFLSIFLLYFLVYRKKGHPWVPRLMFPAILLFDLYLFGAEFIQPYKIMNFPEKESIVENLTGMPLKGRVVTLSDRFISNDGLRYGFSSILGYDPLIIRRYIHFILSSQNQKPIDQVVNLSRVGKPGAKLLKLLYLKKAVYDNGIVNLENEISYASIVYQSIVKSPDEILPFMKSDAFDPRTMVVLEPSKKSMLLLPINQETQQGSIKILEYQNEKIHIKVSNKKPGYLILSEIYYPGWKAEVDGKKVKVHRGNYIFRVIPLREGDHEIQLYFISWPLRIGLCISVFTLIGSIWFTFRAVKKAGISKPKRKETEF